MYRMRWNESIFEAIGNVEDCYLEEAEKKGHKKTAILCAAAACFGILLLSAFVLNRANHRTPSNSISELSASSPVKASVIVTDKNTSMYYSQAEDKTYYYTDYTVKVLESFDHHITAGQTLVIRSDAVNETIHMNTSESPTSISVGSNLIVFLFQPAQIGTTQSTNDNIYYISGNGNGAFLIDGACAIRVEDGEAYQIEDLVAPIQPSATTK